MAFARQTDAGIEELTGADIIFADGGVLSYGDFLKWSDSERAERGIFPVVEDDRTPGKITTGSTLAWDTDANVFRRHFTEADPPPPPVPEAISDRQFAQQLAVEGEITEDEAYAWATTGVIPPQLAALLNMLPVEQRFAAKMKIGAARTFERHDPTTVMFGQMYNWTSDKMDQVWRDASVL